MPITVPKRPTNGDSAPMVAHQVRRLSRTVSDSLDAAGAARCGVTMLLGGPKPPVLRRYVSYTSSKTLTSGLGLNCSLTAAISCSRLALRKARTKRRLCERALLKALALPKITAQE